MSNTSKEEIINKKGPIQDNKAIISNFNQSALYQNVNLLNFSKNRLLDRNLTHSIEESSKAFLKTSSTQFRNTLDQCIDMNKIDLSIIKEEKDKNNNQMSINNDLDIDNKKNENYSKQNDEEVQAFYSLSSSYRLIDDVNINYDKELIRLKKLMNPYDSDDMSSESNSIVIQKNKALIENYQRFNTNLEFRDKTPFHNTDDKRIGTIDLPENNNKSHQCSTNINKSTNNYCITPIEGALSDNCKEKEKKKEELKSKKVEKFYTNNNTSSETPGGGNISSQPDDEKNKNKEQLQPIEEMTSNKKINGLELPTNVTILKFKRIKEPNDIIENRKMWIIHDNKYSILPLNDNIILPYQKELMNDSMIKRIKLFYAENQINYQSDIDKKKNSLINEIHLNINGVYSIGPSYPIQRFVSIIGIDNTGPYSVSAKKLESDIQLARNVLSDGDGFYRAIAFSMLEYWIITQSVNRIQCMLFKIIIDFSKEFSSNDFKIDQRPLIVILTLIINNMSKETLATAYELFVKAFITDVLFEYELIKYIKLALADYILRNISNIDINIIQKQIPSEYFSNQKFNAIQYINDKILIKKEEPNNFIISILPKALGLNVIFYYIEPINLIRNQFIGNEETNHDKSFIIIIKSLARYEIGYRYSIMFANVNNYFVNNSIAYKNRFIEKAQITTCAICKNQGREISLKLYPEASMCRKCLCEGINQTIRKLVNLIKEGNYNHFECRYIPI